MRKAQTLRFLSLAIALMVVVASCSSCSPVYVLRGAYEEAGILLKRRDIDEVLKDERTSPEESQKLQTVKDAREFGIKIGLTPGRSFTKYTRIDKDVLTWVVVASRADSFSLKTWWFPIVGTLPYKGYFEKQDADAEAQSLSEDGYETWVRGSEAFSTLGWFNDPVLTPTLKQQPHRIASTVLHESVHSTVWIPDNVAFNESLANFVGLEASVQFFEHALAECKDDATCKEKSSRLLDASSRSRSAERTIASGVEALYKDLAKLYGRALTREEKLQQRETIFQQHTAALHTSFPSMTVLRKVNNAEIVQLILYMTELDRFAELFRRLNSDWRLFFDKMREIAKDVAETSTKDPFNELRRQIASLDQVTK